MKITYMAFLGMLIALMVSFAENSTPTISEVNISDISKTTQSEQPTPQPDTDTIGNSTTSSALTTEHSRPNSVLSSSILTVYSSIKSVTYGPQKVVSTSVLPQRRPNE